MRLLIIALERSSSCAEQTFRGGIRRNDAQAQLVLVHENAAATLFPESLHLALDAVGS
jgi:hypothetical protein